MLREAPDRDYFFPVVPMQQLKKLKRPRDRLWIEPGVTGGASLEMYLSHDEANCLVNGLMDAMSRQKPNEYVRLEVPIADHLVEEMLRRVADEEAL